VFTDSGNTRVGGPGMGSRSEKGVSMRTGIFGILTCAMFGVLQAQTIDLKGRVLANGAPVADATVDLKVKGSSTKTASDGSFAFGTVALAPAGMSHSEYRLEADFLSLRIGGRRELRLEIFDNEGRLQGSLDRSLGEGRHRIALSEAMPPGATAGLYFLRTRLGGETSARPFFYSGTRSMGTVFAPALRIASAKPAAAVDTLRVKKTGFQDYVKEITSYTAGDLGDMSLSPAAPDGWVNLFNGKDLTGWIPLIHKSKVGENYMDTFRADSVNKVIRVSYDKYPNQDFSDRCGLLYYDKRLTNYRVRVTYRFSEPQAKNPVGWGRNNSGLMIFGIDPRTVTGDPEFPPLIEIQLLGDPSSPSVGGGGTGSGTTSPNECEPGGMKMATHTADCGNNYTKKPPNPAGQWTTVEAEVHVTGQTKVFQLPDTTKPVFTMSGPSYKGQPVTGGYISLQTESQPVEFKDILLKELPQ
jgi:hypothetical protein